MMRIEPSQQGGISLKYYRIGEFAKKNGISVELLKYYDRIGLLSPVWRDESGSRYYADFQIVHLAEYYQLQKLGLSLQSIKTLWENGNLADWQKQLASSRITLEEEICERQATLRYIENLQESFKWIQHQKKWSIEQWDGGFFLEKEHTVITPLWKGTRNISEVWQRVLLNIHGNTTGKNDNFERQWGMLLPNDTPLSACNEVKLEKIPDGSCFLYAHSIPADYTQDPSHLSDAVWNFDLPLQIMTEHGLTPRGDLYQRRLCVTHEENGPQVHVLTRIPIL